MSVRALACILVGVCLFSLAYAHAGVRCARVPLRVVFFCCHICHMGRDEWEQREWEMRLTRCPLNHQSVKIPACMAYRFEK